MNCKTCGGEFESKRPRTFCSVKCGAADPEFRATLLRNLATPNSRSGPERSGSVQPCIVCGVEICLTATAAKRGKKACSRSCWRAWMADRFDRHVGAVESVAAMSRFDGYLSQEKLQCLVDGCNWQGGNLGMHVNAAHGITADELKSAAGFNRSTGLTSGPLQRLYEARGSVGHTPSLNRTAALAAHPMRAQKRSREAAEHFEKSMAITKALKQPQETRK